MAIIVEAKTTRKRFFLLGAGFGMYKSTRPSFFGGTLFPNEEEGVSQTIAVCDDKGSIFFYKKEEIRILEIDGVPVKDFKKVLNTHGEETGVDYCPACGGRIYAGDLKCPHCGIVYR